MEGWIKLHRQIMEHPDYFCEPFTRIMAWIDLLMLANHRGVHIRVRGNKVEVKRGETAIAQENLASRWKWSRGKVKRYLNELENDHWIIQQKSSVINTISIINYESCQGDDTTGGTVNDTTGSTADGRQTAQQTDTNKNVKNTLTKKENKQKKESFGIAEFEIFWDRFHAITGKPKTDKEAALKHWKRLKRAEQQKATDNIRSYFLSLGDFHYCKKARTYLADKNFNDEFIPASGMDYKIPL